MKLTTKILSNSLATLIAACISITFSIGAAHASDGIEGEGLEVLVYLGGGFAQESGTITFVDEETVVESDPDGSFLSLDGRVAARYWLSDRYFLGLEGDGSVVVSGGDSSEAGDIDLTDTIAGFGVLGLRISDNELGFLRVGYQDSSFEVGGDPISVDAKVAYGVGVETKTSWFGGGRLRIDVVRQGFSESESQIGLDGSLVKGTITYGIKF